MRILRPKATAEEMGTAPGNPEWSAAFAGKPKQHSVSEGA